MGVQSAGWGVLSEMADIASGNYEKTAQERIQGAFVEQFLKGLHVPKVAREKAADAVNATNKTLRCAR
jgi:hypothetical protein